MTLDEDHGASPAEPSPAGEQSGEEEPVPVPLPAPVRHPRTFGGLFYLAVLVATLVGIGIVGFGDWRLGIRVVAGSLAAAAALRLVVPEKDAGMLAVRRRLIDVLLLAAVAAGLLVLAASIPDQPV